MYSIAHSKIVNCSEIQGFVVYLVKHSSIVLVVNVDAKSTLMKVK